MSLKMNVFKSAGVNNILFFFVQIKIFTTRENPESCGGRLVTTDKKVIGSKLSHNERGDKS
jgi:hypothetical protein